MSASQPQPQPGLLDKVRSSMNVAMLFVGVFAVSLEVFLHRDFGSRYLDWRAGAVLILVPIYALIFPQYDPAPLYGFLLAYLVMLVFAKAQCASRDKRGDRCHSYYTGWPRGMTGRGQWSEITVKRYVEPAFVGVMGFFIADVSPPLGNYLLLGAASLAVSVGAWQAADRQRTLDLHDVVFDQEHTAERFRAMRGER